MTFLLCIVQGTVQEDGLAGRRGVKATPIP